VLDRRGAIAKAIQAHLDQASVSVLPTAAEGDAGGGRDHYRIRVAQTFVSLMNVDDLGDARERTRSFLEMAMGYLDQQKHAAKATILASTAVQSQ
jgi:hypothetical protein